MTDRSRSGIVRDSLHSLPRYVPGARPAPREDGKTVWKLSSNENPAGPLPAIRDAIIDVSGSVNRYPDMYATELVGAIAEHLGVSSDQVVVGNGSVAVLGHVLSALCEKGDAVVFPWRSFEAYPIMVTVAGATAITVPLDEDGRHDLDALSKAITSETRAVLLCSPNNPTGPALAADAVESFLKTVPEDVVVILDEAYHEYVERTDAVNGLELIDSHPNLLVLRTFSKAYGLAGLRVGYAVGNPELITWVRSVSTPFGVNEAAQRAALAALGAGEELWISVKETLSERTRVLEALAEIPWVLAETEGNFYWLALGEDTARFVAEAAEEGLLVRGFAGEGVRVTVGEREANDAMIEFIRAFER